MIRRNILTISMILLGLMAVASPTLKKLEEHKVYALVLQDTTEEESLTEEESDRFRNFGKRVLSADTLNLENLVNQPYSNLADYLKGSVAGAYIQQPSEEVGTYQNILVRGAGSPIYDNKVVFDNRPVVFVNGVPMAIEHSYAFRIQKEDLNRIGPATDPLNNLNINDVESVEVIKDPVRLAELGPLAANGAIWVTTRGGKSGEREISINSRYGITQTPSITPVNADYENLFRQQFYRRYNPGAEGLLHYPGYLGDSTNLNYYGSSNWSDEYYKNRSLYALDLSLRGGTERANFGFFGGHTRTAHTADDNSLNKYNAALNINMLPFTWFTISAQVNASRTARDRNRNLRDRYSEIGYLPELSTPFSPNVDVYRNYLKEHTKSLDDNITNHFLGNLSLGFDILNDLKLTSSFLMDYQEGLRDLFYPSTLMESINYVSNYYGFSQRYIFDNNIRYSPVIDDVHKLNFKLGFSYQDDLYRFNYARAFDGPNDFIKINVVEGDSKKDDYMIPQGGVNVYRWNNKEIFRMTSLYGSAEYNYESLTFSTVLRYDGSSTIQPDSRYFFSPAFSGKWNVAEYLNQEDAFDINLSWSRLAKPQFDSRFSMGPLYQSNLAWDTERSIASYYGFAAISRPYESGWVGYNTDWEYADNLDFTINKGFFDNQLFTSLSLYHRKDKNQIVLLPVPEEYGYVGKFQNGLDIKNQGVDFTIGAKNVLTKVSENFIWTPSLNLSYNTNEVTALPNGLQELEVGNRLLKVGERHDAFWLYENQGIIENTSQIPSGQTFNGIDLAIGDPLWADKNGDNKITKADKSIQSHALPSVFGGFSNRLAYKNFDLNFNLYFALGHKALNQKASNKYDFINKESSNSLEGVKEIFDWQQNVDITKYPLYNVWSSVVPYREDQDLFLEDASYLKLRSLTLGYDLTQASFLSSVPTLRRAYVYFTANNLFTVSSFSGRDPERVNFNGYYDGYGFFSTPVYSLGFKLDI